MQLILTESLLLEDYETPTTEELGSLQRNPWKEEVPILNSSIRSGSSDRVWAGRTVEIRRVAERWFTFKEVD